MQSLAGNFVAWKSKKTKQKTSEVNDENKMEKN